MKSILVSLLLAWSFVSGCDDVVIEDTPSATVEEDEVAVETAAWSMCGCAQCTLEDNVCRRHCRWGPATEECHEQCDLLNDQCCTTHCRGDDPWEY